MYSSVKKLRRVLAASEIRKVFVDYFVKSHDHKFIRSSPVVPFCDDPTLAFVNSGMNQFKSIFLGKTLPPYPRVVNSQKCVRVGGKHNDLDVVGTDSYHHTFFEMLGNWSFGDYFKREACEMALYLLREPYGIPMNRLYVTYFAGDRVLGLPADLECYEIWRSLGFPESRILPFGSNDNFWEMGNTGPCGPCTEIHIDHNLELSNSPERAKLVNAGFPDLTELWNLVFIQYNRNADGTITPLPANHVDTGMGFERLTAVLQNKMSNYDTDLFVPIFDAIQKISKTPHYSSRFPNDNDDAALDTAYRILADHVRMVSVCLADGMLPDQNQKLRRVLRRAFKISEHIFNRKNLVMELIPVVVEILGATYPELNVRQGAILELLTHEQDVYDHLRSSSIKAFKDLLIENPQLECVDFTEYPGFLSAYRDFQANKSNFVNKVIPGKFLFKLFDTYGLTEESFQKLAELEDMSCDLEAYKEELLTAKLRSKSSYHNVSDDSLIKLTQQISATDNSYKYNYTYDKKNRSYNIPNLTATVQGMLLNDKAINVFDKTEFESNADGKLSDLRLTIITDKSNFYYESGGQQSDKGMIFIYQTSDNTEQKISLNVEAVKFINDCILHVCKISTNEEINYCLKIGDKVDLSIDATNRQNLMCHHTATHLINGAIRTLFNKITYQVSSSVTSDACKIELGLIGKRLSKDDVAAIEDLIGRIICSSSPIQTSIINAADVSLENDIITIPGEIYPENGLRLVSILCKQLNLISKELCCGTHVLNTQELEYFCITNLKLTNRARYAFTAVAGSQAEKVLKAAALLKHRMNLIEQQCQTDKVTNATEIELQEIRNNILHTPSFTLPYVMRIETLERINDLLKSIKDSSRTSLIEFVEVEMKNLLREKTKEEYPYLLHYIRSSALVEEVPLQQATRLCTDRPILVIVMCNGIVKARCCVPKNFVTKDFNAEAWLRVLANSFGAQLKIQKGQDSTRVCNMKSKKVGTQFYEKLEIAMEKANDFAKQHLP